MACIFIFVVRTIIRPVSEARPVNFRTIVTGEGCLFIAEGKHLIIDVQIHVHVLAIGAPRTAHVHLI